MHIWIPMRIWRNETLFVREISSDLWEILVMGKKGQKECFRRISISVSIYILAKMRSV